MHVLRPLSHSNSRIFLVASKPATAILLPLLVASAEGYEVRFYDPYLVAEAKVLSGTDDPLGDGFRMLSDYIGRVSRKIGQGNRGFPDSQSIRILL